MGTGTVSTGAPSRLRSFDPVRIAGLEYRMWVGYYQQRWTRVLAAAVRLAWLGFGMDWVRTLQGAWLLLRAIQLWAPFPGNDPDGARACMRQLYALVKLRFGEPADPERAAVLEVDWWRVHRERQRSPGSAESGDELVESVTRLYGCVFGEAEAEVRPRRTGSGRWICPISGSGKAASRTARCSRWNTPRWSAPTLRCSPRSTTTNADEWRTAGPGLGAGS